MMPLTNAERQKAYRASRSNAGENGKRQLNVWVDTGVALALDRLANSYGITKSEMLARLVSPADDAILARMDIGTPEWTAYMGGKGLAKAR